MKKKLVALMLAGMCAAPSFAQAATPYVSAYTGLAFPGNSTTTVAGITVNDACTFKTAVPFGGSVGLKSDCYRIEAALGYVVAHVDKAKEDGTNLTSVTGYKLSVFSYMANAYYDVAIKDSSITPYVMGGIGGATLKPKDNNFTGQSKSVFAWQLGTGIGIKATDDIVVDLGYRYFKPGAYKDGEDKATSSSSNILLGLRYNF
ncbi:MAG: porin family protein [Chlorobiaceae bacterium]|nr:porin family protein [Chlorobiaceae bacterium]